MDSKQLFISPQCHSSHKKNLKIAKFTCRLKYILPSDFSPKVFNFTPYSNLQSLYLKLLATSTVYKRQIWLSTTVNARIISWYLSLTFSHLWNCAVIFIPYYIFLLFPIYVIVFPEKLEANFSNLNRKTASYDEKYVVYMNTPSFTALRFPQNQQRVPNSMITGYYSAQ